MQQGGLRQPIQRRAKGPHPIIYCPEAAKWPEVLCQDHEPRAGRRIPAIRNSLNMKGFRMKWASYK